MPLRNLLLTIAASLAPTAAALLAQTSPATTTPAFDVASIRENNTATDGRHHIYSSPNDSHFRTVNLSVKDLLQFAYALPANQIVGGPAWLDSLDFDIDAKAGPEIDARMHDLPSEQGRLIKQQMVQALLADRFQLKAHQETRQLPIYSLVVANPKAGPKFKPSEADGTTIDTGRSSIHVQGSDHTVDLLARQLALVLGRVVIDHTGIDGRYDLTLRWTPDDAAPAGSAALANAPPDIFTAIQEQLGLKLQPAKGPVPVLVIDQIAMPSPN
jgi:uncharacterized protein (TIGR03435 family)